MEMNGKLIEKLRRLGFPLHMRGTWYLHDAARLWVPGAYLTKEIYPEVARLHGVTWQSVERCVRSTIEYVWDHRRGRTGEIIALLGLARMSIKPPAAELVAALGLWLRQEGGTQHQD